VSPIPGTDALDRLFHRSSVGDIQHSRLPLTSHIPAPWDGSIPRVLNLEVNTKVLGLWAFPSLRNRQVMREFSLFPISLASVNITGIQRDNASSGHMYKQTALHNSISPTQSVRDITSTLSSSTTQTHSCTVETALGRAVSSHIASPFLGCSTPLSSSVESIGHEREYSPPSSWHQLRKLRVRSKAG
jgi:hypothetical protein